MNEILTLCKLIILYLLERVDFPLSYAQLSEFILEREYVNYFTFQQAIVELTEIDYIKAETVRNTSLYRITKEGQKSLTYFQSKISSLIREDIETFLIEHKYQLRNETSTLADYYRTTSGDYAARCRVLEKDSTLIDLTLTVPTEDQAISICKNWKEKSQELYTSIIHTLF
jgi:DNA-binding PadR family transcriptional regulator